MKWTEFLPNQTVLPLVVRIGLNFFYNNSNKFWIELLYALLSIDIGVE